jgi:hypothetical protein
MISEQEMAAGRGQAALTAAAVEAEPTFCPRDSRPGTAADTVAVINAHLHLGNLQFVSRTKSVSGSRCTGLRVRWRE